LFVTALANFFSGIKSIGLHSMEAYKRIISFPRAIADMYLSESDDFDDPGREDTGPNLILLFFWRLGGAFGLWST
jgi:hypothetical protein